MGQPAEEDKSTMLVFHAGLNQQRYVLKHMLFVIPLVSVRQHLNLCDPALDRAGQYTLFTVKTSRMRLSILKHRYCKT